MKASRTSPATWLVWAILTGLAARGLIFFALRDAGGVRMGDDYILFGRQLIENGWSYDDPVRSPLGTYLSAWMIAVAGHHAEWAVGVVQLALSVLLCVSAYLIAKKIWNEKAGLAAAFLAALDPLLIMYGATISSEAIYVPFLLLSLALALGALGRPGRVASPFLLGLSLLVCQYTRASAFILLAAMWVAAFLIRLPIKKRLAVASLVFVLGCVPWVVRNHAKYGVAKFSSSSDYNMAALYIGSAKMRADMAYADSVGAGANLNVWNRELAPQQPGENSFEYSERAKEVALAWARDHKGEVLREGFRGLVRRWLSPGDTRYGLAFLGREERSLGLAIPLGIWRLALGTLALLGIGFGARIAATRKETLFVGIVMGFNYLSMGPMTDARFFAPDAAMLCPLAAGGLLFLGFRVFRSRTRSLENPPSPEGSPDAR